MPTYGAIDLGSHTVRSIVAEYWEDSGEVVPLEHKRAFTRFALEVADGFLSRRSLDHTLKVLESYVKHFDYAGVCNYLCGATGVFRTAKNARTFKEEVKRQLGLNLFILSEEEESYLSARGALWVLNSLKFGRRTMREDSPEDGANIVMRLGAYRNVPLHETAKSLDDLERQIISTSKVLRGNSTVTLREKPFNGYEEQRKPHDTKETSKTIVIFDLGGSSTEITVMETNNPLHCNTREINQRKWWKSFFIGAASLTRTSLRRAPTREVEVERAFDEAKKVFLAGGTTNLSSLFDIIGNDPDGFSLIGLGGTAATLGAMKIGMDPYEPYKICGLSVSLDWIKNIIRELAPLPLEKRRIYAGLEEGREDVIIGGAVITAALMELLNKSELEVSDAGLLEGLLMKALEVTELSRKVKTTNEDP